MVRYIQNSGESVETAIVILDAQDNREGVRAEYTYLEGIFGRQGVDWKLGAQRLLKVGDKQFDQLDLIFPHGSRKSVFFDITAFFGKF